MGGAELFNPEDSCLLQADNHTHPSLKKSNYKKKLKKNQKNLTPLLYSGKIKKLKK